VDHIQEPAHLHAGRQTNGPTATRRRKAAVSAVDFADGNPARILISSGRIFFANPGYTLGGRKKRVLTQAQNIYDAAAFPTDGQYA
jgi:hypothetical protein